MVLSITNYSSFFFNEMRELGDNYTEIIDTVNHAKIELEGAVVSLSNDLSDEICKIFDISKSTPLGTLFVNQYDVHWATKRKKSFDYFTNTFLEFASNVQASERDYDIILRLARTLTGLELVYWNDSHKAEFVDRLRAVNEKLLAYNGAESISEHETKMILVTSDGREKSIVFDHNELSRLSKTVKNKINSTFGNYGLSISYDDKVQILLSIIEDLLEGK